MNIKLEIMKHPNVLDVYDKEDKAIIWDIDNACVSVGSGKHLIAMTQKNKVFYDEDKMLQFLDEHHIVFVSFNFLQMADKCLLVYFEVKSDMLTNNNSKPIEVNSLCTTAPIDRVVMPKDKLTYLYLGAIPNMGGHCSIINISTGEVFVSYHIDDIRELTDQEI